MTPEKLVEKMGCVGYSVPEHIIMEMLRIVLKEIQDGGVVDWQMDMDGQIKIKLDNDYQKFMEGK